MGGGKQGNVYTKAANLIKYKYLYKLTKSNNLLGYRFLISDENWVNPSHLIEICFLQREVELSRYLQVF
jgi:hypothetical protein